MFLDRINITRVRIDVNVSMMKERKGGERDGWPPCNTKFPDHLAPMRGQISLTILIKAKNILMFELDRKAAID